MTADDRKALGPDGVALAEALGAKPTLHEALAARGYRAEPTQRQYAKAIVRVDAPAGSAPVFIGTEGEVWAWLNEGGATDVSTTFQWLRAVPESGRDAPPCPVDALAEGVRQNSMMLWGRHSLAILDELRQTRAERDAARQELAAARAQLHAVGEVLADAVCCCPVFDAVCVSCRARAAMLPALPEVGA